ncbi:MAG: hypothetical protein JRI22_01795 [Deltaproteobacteria bacterium]|nr:hypothetical protein [Deltaproteobacteria bacterium]
MSTLVQRTSAAFAGGCLGGLVNSFCVWIFGLLGITTSLGVQIAPAIAPAWLYPRIVWGGIWGILFLLPWKRGSVILRGLIFSLGPTAVQLLVVFPFKTQKGALGLSLGALTPLFVVIFNAVWGIATAWWVVRVVEK